MALVGILAGWWQPEGRFVHLAGTALAWRAPGAGRWPCANALCAKPHCPSLKRKLREIYPPAPRTPTWSSADCASSSRLPAQPRIFSGGRALAGRGRAVERLLPVTPRPITTGARARWGTPRNIRPPRSGQEAHHNDGLRRAWYWACWMRPSTPQAQPPAPAVCAGRKTGHSRRFHYAPDLLQRWPCRRFTLPGAVLRRTDFPCQQPFAEGFQGFWGADQPNVALPCQRQQ